MVSRIDLIPLERIIAFARELELSPEKRARWSNEEINQIIERAKVEQAKNGIAAKLNKDLDGAVDAEAASVLKIRGLTYKLDDIADKSLQTVNAFYKQKVQEATNGRPKRDRIVERGISATVAKVSKRLNARGLEDIERALLAFPAVYELLLMDALDREKVETDDDEGLFDSVLRAVVVQPRRRLLNEITGHVLALESINLDDAALVVLRDVVAERGISLVAGSVRPGISKLVEESLRLGTLQWYVERYADKGEINRDLFTDPVKQEMGKYLNSRGIRIKRETKEDILAFDHGKYDEHFALAFDHAIRVTEEGEDPIDVARKKGSISDWNFKIRRISESDRPIIRDDMIRAAGALYTTFVEGEQMHIFDIADALLIDWHRGDLDIPDGEAASLLNRFEILMRDRPTPEERQMHYKRVFNIGDAETLSGTVINEAFPGLWDNMMYEVTRYIDKVEQYYTDEKHISRAALYQAIKDLQYNLSEYMSGSTPKKTAEMYKHLEEALDILGSEDVLNHMGGRRKSLLTVIERVGKEALSISIPTNSLVTLAERGNDIFQFIASFAAENVDDDVFQRFLDDCKACIVSQASFEPPEDVHDSTHDYNGSMKGNGNGRYRNGSRRMESAVVRNNGNGNFDDWES